MLPNFQVTRTLCLFLASGVDIYFGLAQKNSSMREEAAFRWEPGQEQNVSGSGWSGKCLVTQGKKWERFLKRETLQLQKGSLWQTWNVFSVTAFRLLPLEQWFQTSLWISVSVEDFTKLWIRSLRPSHQVHTQPIISFIISWRLQIFKTFTDHPETSGWALHLPSLKGWCLGKKRNDFPLGYTLYTASLG